MLQELEESDVGWGDSELKPKSGLPPLPNNVGIRTKAAVMNQAPVKAATTLSHIEREPFDTQTFVSESLGTAYRMGAIALISMALAYASVVPAPLPPGTTGFPGFAPASRRAYNLKYEANCALLAAVAAPSLLFSLLVFDRNNMRLHSFCLVLLRSFTTGFALSFILEVILATLVRSALYAWLEPEIMTALTPQVSLTALPWLLSDYGYIPVYCFLQNNVFYLSISCILVCTGLGFPLFECPPPRFLK